MMQHQLLLTTLKTFDIESIKERLASLVVGYNNLAVELEYLKHDLESKKVFSVASSFA
jgi:regulator of replication initiation timing